MIPNEEEEAWYYPPVKNNICIIEKKNFKT